MLTLTTDQSARLDAIYDRANDVQMSNYSQEFVGSRIWNSLSGIKAVLYWMCGEEDQEKAELARDKAISRHKEKEWKKMVARKGARVA